MKTSEGVKTVVETGVVGLLRLFPKASEWIGRTATHSQNKVAGAFEGITGRTFDKEVYLTPEATGIKIADQLDPYVRNFLRSIVFFGPTAAATYLIRKVRGVGVGVEETEGIGKVDGEKSDSPPDLKKEMEEFNDKLSTQEKMMKYLSSEQHGIKKTIASPYSLMKHFWSGPKVSQMDGDISQPKDDIPLLN